MGQRAIFTRCPVCGGRWKFACYGVVHGKDGGVIRRYFYCRRCGSRVAREYREEWRIVLTSKELI